MKDIDRLSDGVGDMGVRDHLNPFPPRITDSDSSGAEDFDLKAFVRKIRVVEDEEDEVDKSEKQGLYSGSVNSQPSSIWVSLIFPFNFSYS
jgi:hypothetical protein